MIYIDKSCTLIEALKKMDSLERKLLIVTSNEIFFGLISAGDIQRAIIKNYDLKTAIEKIIRKNIKVARKTDDFESVKKMMIEFRMEFCPVIGEDNSITEIYYWEDVFKETKRIQLVQFNLPIVIMAGGIGSRLKPLTNVIPKPLIPIGDKSMLEHIFERFYKHGSDTFFISVNYKSELIKFYLNEQNLPYNLNYFKEEKPSGTAGSLSLLKGKLKSTFFVSNCDILIEEDYSEILKYHNENNNEITIIAALKHYSIPYGTLETAEDGKLVSLHEKPDLNFMINSGLYILEPHLLNEIPEDTFFHITDLIDIVKKRNGTIGVFPVSEASWFDIGEWSEYNKTQELLTKKNLFL